MVGDVQIGRAVVGVDPSEGARSALRWATYLVGGSSRGRPDQGAGEVVLVHARGLLERASGSTQDLPAWLEALIDSVDPEISLTLRVVDGPAPEALLLAAEETNADVIVVGKRGWGSPFELTLGSTSREVTSRAAVAVLVVPLPLV